MTVVYFDGREWDGNMPLEEFAAALGARNGFRVVGDAFRRNIPLETYEIAPEAEMSAQELIDSC